MEDPNTTPLKTSTTLKAKIRSSYFPLIALIASFIIIVGGLSFAIFTVSRNKPENILSSALYNLINANYASATGTISLTAGENITNFTGIASLDLRLDLESEKALKNSANLAATITFSDGHTIETPTLGEVAVEFGTYYLKISDLAVFYDTQLKSDVTEYLRNLVENRYRYSGYYKCLDTPSDGEDYYDLYQKCNGSFVADFTPDDEATIASAVEVALTTMDEIIELVDNQWIRVSIDEILDSSLVNGFTYRAQESETQTEFNCVKQMLDDPSPYLNELGTIYGKYPFLKLTPTNDSFYDLSLKDFSTFSDYLNAIERTSLVYDLADCMGIRAETELELAQDTDYSYLVSSLDSLPKFSARFDGFLDHHLAELKFSQDKNVNSYVSVAGDLKFVYQEVEPIATPSDSQSIVDLIQTILSKIEVLTRYFEEPFTESQLF